MWVVGHLPFWCTLAERPKSEKSIMLWTVVSLVRQTGWTTADHVWCEKLASGHRLLGDSQCRKLSEIQTEYAVFCI